MANCAHITRRSIFKLAPAAVLATGGTIAAFSPLPFALEVAQSKSSRDELLSLWEQLSEPQQINVLEFLRRAHSASIETVK